MTEVEKAPVVSAPPDPTFLETNLEKIDEQLASQKELVDREVTRLCALQRHRNSLVPISRMPPELLCRTLFFLVCSEFYEEEPPPTGVGKTKKPSKRPESWIHVIHVCHWWRDTAIACRSLWSLIDVFPDKAEITTWKLQISGSCPLFIRALRPPNEKIRFRGGPPESAEQEEDPRLSCLKHMNRIQELEIAMHSDNTDLDIAMAEPAPLLESLTIHAPNYCSLKAALSGGAPRLRRLQLNGSLHYTPLITNPPWLSNLTHLDLRHISTTDIFSSLANTTALEFLRLEYTTIMPDPPTPVTLSQLKSIHLVDNEDQCLILLKHMTFPTNIKFQIECTVEGENIDNLISFIGTRFFVSTDDGGIISRIRLNRPGGPGDHFVMLGWNTPEDGIDDLPRIHLALKWRGPCVTSRTWNALRIAALSFGLSNVETLWMDGFGLFTGLQPTILDALQCFTGLKHFVISRTTTRFLKALKASEEAKERPEPLFPSLSRVGIGAVSGSEGLCYDIFVSWLKSRRGRGSGVEELDIDDSIIRSEARYEMLSHILEKLEWDGGLNLFHL